MIQNTSPTQELIDPVVAPRITIVLADDRVSVRREIRELLERETDMTVVGEAGNGLEAVALVKQLRPAVVLLDVTMPQLNGLQAAAEIHQTVPTTKIIMLSAHDDEAYVAAAIAVGAVGYLIKFSAGDHFGPAIRAVMAGKTYFSPSLPKWIYKPSMER